MAQTGCAIAAARLEYVQRLQAAKDTPAAQHFPRALLRARGTVEDLLSRATALEVEEMLAYQLKQSRERDAVSGGAANEPPKPISGTISGGSSRSAAYSTICAGSAGAACLPKKEAL